MLKTFKSSMILVSRMASAAAFMSRSDALAGVGKLIAADVPEE